MANITKVTLFISWTLQNPPSNGGCAYLSLSPSMGLGAIDLIFTCTPFPGETDSVDITGSIPGGVSLATIQALPVYIRNYGSLNVSVGSGMAFASTLTVYELWLVVAYDDGTQEKWVPSYGTGYHLDGSVGSIVGDPLQVADGNPSTGVSIVRTRYASLADGNIESLYYTSFVPPPPALVIGPHPYTVWSVSFPCIPCNPI